MAKTVQEFLEKQKEAFQEFFLSVDDTGVKEHVRNGFDWYIFPSFSKRSEWSVDISKPEGQELYKELSKNQEYAGYYFDCIKIYLKACGWDYDNQRAIRGKKLFSDYEIRFSKLVQSLIGMTDNNKRVLNVTGFTPNQQDELFLNVYKFAQATKQSFASKKIYPSDDRLKYIGDQILASKVPNPNQGGERPGGKGKRGTSGRGHDYEEHKDGFNPDPLKNKKKKAILNPELFGPDHAEAGITSDSLLEPGFLRQFFLGPLLQIESLNPDKFERSEGELPCEENTLQRGDIALYEWGSSDNPFGHAAVVARPTEEFLTDDKTNSRLFHAFHATEYNKKDGSADTESRADFDGLLLGGRIFRPSGPVALILPDNIEKIKIHYPGFDGLLRRKYYTNILDQFFSSKKTNEKVLCDKVIKYYEKIHKGSKATSFCSHLVYQMLQNSFVDAYILKNFFSDPKEGAKRLEEAESKIVSNFNDKIRKHFEGKIADIGRAIEKRRKKFQEPVGKKNYDYLATCLIKFKEIAGKITENPKYKCPEYLELPKEGKIIFLSQSVIEEIKRINALPENEQKEDEFLILLSVAETIAGTRKDELEKLKEKFKQEAINSEFKNIINSELLVKSSDNPGEPTTDCQLSEEGQKLIAQAVAAFPPELNKRSSTVTPTNLRSLLEKLAKRTKDFTLKLSQKSPACDETDPWQEILSGPLLQIKSLNPANFTYCGKTSSGAVADEENKLKRGDIALFQWGFFEGRKDELGHAAVVAESPKKEVIDRRNGHRLFSVFDALGGKAQTPYDRSDFDELTRDGRIFRPSGLAASILPYNIERIKIRYTILNKYPGNKLGQFFSSKKKNERFLCDRIRKYYVKIHGFKFQEPAETFCSHLVYQMLQNSFVDAYILRNFFSDPKQGAKRLEEAKEQLDCLFKEKLAQSFEDKFFELDITTSKILVKAKILNEKEIQELRDNFATCIKKIQEIEGSGQKYPPYLEVPDKGIIPFTEKIKDKIKSINKLEKDEEKERRFLVLLDMALVKKDKLEEFLENKLEEFLEKLKQEATNKTFRNIINDELEFKADATDWQPGKKGQKLIAQAVAAFPPELKERSSAVTPTNLRSLLEKFAKPRDPRQFAPTGDRSGGKTGSFMATNLHGQERSQLKPSSLSWTLNLVKRLKRWFRGDCENFIEYIAGVIGQNLQDYLRDYDDESNLELSFGGFRLFPEISLVDGYYKNPERTEKEDEYLAVASKYFPKMDDLDQYYLKKIGLEGQKFKGHVKLSLVRKGEETFIKLSGENIKLEQTPENKKPGKEAPKQTKAELKEAKEKLEENKSQKGLLLEDQPHLAEELGIILAVNAFWGNCDINPGNLGIVAAAADDQKPHLVSFDFGKALNNLLYGKKLFGGGIHRNATNHIIDYFNRKTVAGPLPFAVLKMQTSKLEQNYDKEIALSGEVLKGLKKLLANEERLRSCIAQAFETIEEELRKKAEMSPKYKSQIDEALTKILITPGLNPKNEGKKMILNFEKSNKGYDTSYVKGKTISEKLDLIRDKFFEKRIKDTKKAVETMERQLYIDAIIEEIVKEKETGVSSPVAKDLEDDIYSRAAQKLKKAGLDMRPVFENIIDVISDNHKDQKTYWFGFGNADLTYQEYLTAKFKSLNKELSDDEMKELSDAVKTKIHSDAGISESSRVNAGRVFQTSKENWQQAALKTITATAIAGDLPVTVAKVTEVSASAETKPVVVPIYDFGINEAGKTKVLAASCPPLIGPGKQPIADKFSPAPVPKDSIFSATTSDENLLYHKFVLVLNKAIKQTNEQFKGRENIVKEEIAVEDALKIIKQAKDAGGLTKTIGKSEKANDKRDMHFSAIFQKESAKLGLFTVRGKKPVGLRTKRVPNEWIERLEEWLKRSPQTTLADAAAIETPSTEITDATAQRFFKLRNISQAKVGQETGQSTFTNTRQQNVAASC